MSDEALQGLGTTLNFLKTSLFGAVLQLVRPSPPSLPQSGYEQGSRVYEGDNDGELEADDDTAVGRPAFNPASKTFEQTPTSDHALSGDEDPYIPLKPARRKAAAADTADDGLAGEVAGAAEDEGLQLTLTDFVPDVGYFIAGGLSGITSRTVTAPLDRLKVYLIAQTGTAQGAVEAAKSGAAIKATQQGFDTIRKACRELWAAGGIRSMFAGEATV